MYDITKEELVKLIKSIMTLRDSKTGKKLTEQEHLDLVNKFKASIKHSGGSDLIYYPELIEEFKGLGREPTAEEIAEAALKGNSK